MSGQHISHYRLVEKVGEGASGVIYKAEDLALGRLVALKCLPAAAGSPGAVRFQHEARTASNVAHPNVCTIHEIGEHEGQPFLVLEWLDGTTLAARLKRRPLAPGEIVDIGSQLADGLTAIHAAGIVHRDVKPGNIFLTTQGQVKLIDFGVSLLIPRTPSGEHSGDGLLAGTSAYMSPEQLLGLELDPRSDIFSLGSVLYEMSAGRHPFAGDTDVDMMHRILDAAPAPLAARAGLSGDLARIVTKALEKDRKLRYQTASDLRADLERLRRDAASSSPPRAHHSRARRAMTAATLAASGAAAALAMNLYLERPDSQSTAAAMVAGPSRPARTSDITIVPTPSKPAAPAPRRGSRLAGGTGAPTRSTALTTLRGPLETDAAAIEREIAIAKTKADAGLNDQALDTLRGVLSRHAGAPAALDAYTLMAAILEAQHKPEDAMGTYLEIGERYLGNPRAAQALYRYAELIAQSARPGRDAHARQVLGQIAAAYADSDWAARALLKKGEIEERARLYQFDSVLGTSVPTALITYRQLIARYPTAPGIDTALGRLADLYDQRGRFELAAATYVTLAERFPRAAPDAWYLAAELYRRQLNDETRARSAYARVTRLSRFYREAQSRIR